jgi:TM2 domain protein
MYTGQPKNKIVAAVLAFFFGTFGVHNFYLGYTKRGAYQLGLAIAGIVLSIVVIGVFLIIAAGIWALVDFIMILIATPDQMYGHDANGVPLAS